MLEEKIKIATETAVAVAAKPSGIFPQPEAGLVDRQTQVCFSSLFQCAQSLRIVISHNFYYCYYKAIFHNAFFPPLFLLFFHFLDRVLFMAFCLLVIKVCFVESIVKYVQGWISIEVKVS